MQVSRPSRSPNRHQLLPVVQSSAMLHLASWRRREWLVGSRLILGGFWACCPRGSNDHTSLLMPLLGFFITCSSINIKARHSATYADYAVHVISKCAAHGVREIHTLILAEMILVYLCRRVWNMNIPQLLPLRSNILYFVVVYLSSWQRFIQV